MARERTCMRKCREILRHILDLGLSYEVTEQSLQVSHGQVCRTLAKVRERGLGWAEVAPLSDDELEALLYRPRSACAPTAPLPDWPWVETERRRPGVTLLLLHQEYRAQHPDGLGYSQFCDHYSRFQKERPLLMRQSYPAGDRLLSTTRSKKPSIWTRRPASASRASCLSRCWAPATSPTSRPPGRSAARNGVVLRNASNCLEQNRKFSRQSGENAYSGSQKHRVIHCVAPLRIMLQ